MNGRDSGFLDALAPPLSGDESTRRIHRYLNVILTTSACLVMLFLLLSTDFNTSLFAGILLVYTIIGYGLVKIGFIRFIRVTFPFVTWLVVTGMMLSGLGLRSLAVTALPIAILIGALMGGRKVAYLYTTLSVMSILVAWLGEQWGYVTNGMPEKSTLEDLLNLYMVVAFILALIVALMRHIDDDRLEAIRNEERFKVLSSNLHDMVWTTDLGLNIEFITPSVKHILGYTPEELIGTSFADIMPVEAIASAREILETELDLTQRGLSPYPFRNVQTEVRCKDGTVRWLNARVSFLHDSQGEVLGTVGSAHDVSEQRTSRAERQILESQLHHAQKMESLGQFTGGIVHDFNNILVAIQGYSELLLDSSEDPERTKEFAAEVQRAADRASGLTRQLLSFSRRSDSECSPFGVNTMIQGLYGMLQRLLPETIRFEAELSDEEPIVDGVLGQFEQLIMNLALNARDAMPDGGDLKLESHVVDLGDDFVAKRPGSSAGRYARLRVSDTGCGMSQSELEQVFDAFFTTKEAGHGTGLGMSVVHSIVKRHGGFIDIESTLGQGTIVTTYFPVAIPDRRDHSKRAQDITAGGSEVILLVEDNLHVQHVVAQLLTKAGYSVLTASNGTEGIAVFEKHRDTISVVLTDLVMPEMGGYDLMLRVRAIEPNAPVLFTSGYSIPEDVAKAVEDGDARLIQKPYRPSTLLRFVRTTLDNAAPR